MKLLLPIVALLTSCGTVPPDQTKTPASDLSKPTGGVQFQPANETKKDIVVEYRKTGTSYAITVADTNELPPCTRDNNKQLAWVKTTNQFLSCEDTWVEIPMEAPKVGAVGQTGAKGERGEPGAVGQTGAKGERGESATANQWFDPILGTRALIGAITSEAGLTVVTPCTDGWHLPNLAEAKLAILHGILLAASAMTGPDMLWTSEFRDDLRIAIANNGYTERQSTLAVNAGIACFKDKE